MSLPFFSAEDVLSSVSMKNAIEAMEDAFISLSDGAAIIPNRINISIPDKKAFHLSMPAYIMGGKYITVKLVNIHLNNPPLDLPLINGVIVVMDADRGDTLALIEGKSVTALRTGAASGLATKLLSKPDATTAVIFGSGVQAEYQIKAIQEVRELESIKVLARDQQRLIDFCDQFDNAVQPGEKSDLKQADIVCTATTSTVPLFGSNDVSQGVHINAVGAHGPDSREISANIIHTADVFVDHLPPSKEEAGNILIPINDGSYSWEQIKGELGSILSSGERNLNSLKKNTVFNSIGNAVQDLVIAAKVMESNYNAK